MTIKRPRQHDEKHLAFIRTLPCLCCLNNICTEAAHLRFGDRRAAKRKAGIGEKPSDCWTVPLCGECHRKQHEQNEQEFWDTTMIDPVAIAAWLFIASGDFEAGETIIREQH